jgi:NTE family protein
MDVNNIGDIISQGVEMMMRDGIEKNLLIPDVKIRPNLKGFHMMSFSPQNADTIMVRGYEAAMAQDSLLREIALKTSGKYTLAKKRPALGMRQDSLVIANVDIIGVLPREKEILKDRLHLKYGEKISRDDLDDIVARIYGTQAYDYVTYELKGKDEPFDLVLNCRKGPIHQFGLGVRADTEEIVSVLLNIGLNVHKLHGHMFDFTAKISANPYAGFHWSYDIPKFPTFNGNASIRWTDLNMLNLGNNRLSFNYLSARQELYLSNIKWKQLDIRGGVRNEVIRMGNVQCQMQDCYNLNLLSNDFVSAFVDAGTYTFDDGYFPTRGVSAGLSYSWTFTGFPHSFDNFHTFSADAKVVVPIGDVFAFIPSFDCRFLLGDNVPVPFFNAVGGSLPSRYLDQQMPFVGVTHLSAMKNILTIYRADLRFKVAKNHYLTGIVNYLRDSDSFKTYVDGPGFFGAAVEYSYDTIFGPLSANVHWSDLTGKAGFYISAGYNF